MAFGTSRWVAPEKIRSSTNTEPKALNKNGFSLEYLHFCRHSTQNFVLLRQSESDDTVCYSLLHPSDYNYRRDYSPNFASVDYQTGLRYQIMHLYTSVWLYCMAVRGERHVPWICWKLSQIFQGHCHNENDNWTLIHAYKCVYNAVFRPIFQHFYNLICLLRNRILPNKPILLCEQRVLQHDNDHGDELVLQHAPSDILFKACFDLVFRASNWGREDKQDTDGDSWQLARCCVDVWEWVAFILQQVGWQLFWSFFVSAHRRSQE